MKSLTFRLLKQMPSFVGGFAAAIDFDTSVYDNFSADDTPTEADFKAISSDWRAVGDDLRTAFLQHDQGA